MNELATVHQWESNGRRYRAVYDEDYSTRGSYALETEEATKLAEAEEIAALRSGRYIVIGIIVSEIGSPHHCKTCKCKEPTWHETDSLWGIVIEPDTKAIEAFAESM